MRNLFGFFLPLVVCLSSLISGPLSQAQGVQADPASKKLDSQLIHQFKSVDKSYPNTVWGSRVVYSRATFSPDGSFIILNDLAEHKVYRIDTNTLEKTVVSSSRRIKQATIHNVTGEILAWQFPESVSDAKLEKFFPEDRTKELPVALQDELFQIEERGKVDLVNYKSLEDLKVGKVNWLINFDDDRLINWWHGWHGRYLYQRNEMVCWLPKLDLYALPILQSNEVQESKEELMLINRQGQIVGRFKFGPILGVDISEAGIEVYERIGKRSPNYFVQRSTINDRLTRIEKTEKLSQIPEHLGQGPRLLFGTKQLRYSDHKPGDVRLFFTQLMNDPRFWAFQDYPALAEYFQGQFPELTPSWWGRMGSLGILSAKENPTIPEITLASVSPHSAPNHPFSLELIVDHSGNFNHLPEPCTVEDALFDARHQMMVVRKRSRGPSDKSEFLLVKLVPDPDAKRADAK